MDLSKALKTLAKLLLACLLVGVFLKWVGIDSMLEAYRYVAEAVVSIVEYFQNTFGDIFSVIAIGAVIVVPIWLLMVGMNLLKGRRRSP